jgi:hypothetical protein
MSNGKVILVTALIVAGSLVSHRSRTRPFRIRMEGSLGWSTVHAEEGKNILYLGIHYWSIKRRFFQPQRFDLGRLPQPQLNLLFRRSPRRIRPRLPSVYPTSKG